MRYPAIFYLHPHDTLVATRILSISRGASEQVWLAEQRKAGHPEVWLQELISPFGCAQKKNPKLQPNEVGLNFIDPNGTIQPYHWNPVHHFETTCLAILLNDGKPWAVHHSWATLLAPMDDYAF